MIGEEEITNSIVRFLKSNGWDVFAFDFPQSGTGISLKENGSNKEKNRGSINPDIIATKGDILLIMENKPNFFKKDIEKLQGVKDGKYSESISKHFPNLKYSRIATGIGLSYTDANYRKTIEQKESIEAYVFVNEDTSVSNLSRLPI